MTNRFFVVVMLSVAMLSATGMSGAIQANPFIGNWTGTITHPEREFKATYVVTDKEWIVSSEVLDGSVNGTYTISGNTMTMTRGFGTFGTATISENTVAMNIVMFSPDLSGTFTKGKEPTVIKREFTSAGNHAFVFNEGFPATVEVTVTGAGGGGQGGHTKDYAAAPAGKRTERGVGAGGGSGAVVIAKFEVTSSTTFNITVGEGGAGGAGKSKPVGGSWESGSPGKDGETSRISWGSSTISAEGGKGGGGSGAQNVTGGKGGQAGPAPQGLLHVQILNGYDGGNGQHNSQSAGAAGRAVLGTTHGKGGDGMIGNSAGGKGNNGRVLITITY